MARGTDIEWCDDTANPTMGCDGCELWNDREHTCYAGILHDRYGGVNKGFSPTFDKLTFYPGRMAKAFAAPDLRGKSRPSKPWLDGMPRLIFISDMSDALSRAVPFDYLKAEIIDVVRSPQGQRHVGMWLTKQPARMARFAKWLGDEHGMPWPENLWAGTSLTMQSTLPRAVELMNVPAAVRFLSIEPMRDKFNLHRVLCEYADGGGNLEQRFCVGWCDPRNAFHLVICGGESGTDGPFQIEHARDLRDQCAVAGVPFFMKQLGSRPRRWATKDDTAGAMDAPPEFIELNTKSKKGGDWSEWPADLRIRQMPKATVLA